MICSLFLVKSQNLLVWRLAEEVSAPLSFPAKSTKENLPWSRELERGRRITWKTACEREECALADVDPDVRTLLPCWISFSTSSTVSTDRSHRPTNCTCCFPSSSTLNFALPFNKSNTFTQTKFDHWYFAHNTIWYVFVFDETIARIFKMIIKQNKYK